jgi:hypothetical protein
VTIRRAWRTSELVGARQVCEALNLDYSKLLVRRTASKAPSVGSLLLSCTFGNEKPLLTLLTS